MKQTRRGLFGFTLPKIGLFGGHSPNGDRGEQTDRDDIAEITTTAARVQALPYGKWRIVIAEGATWETTDPTDGNDPKQGSKIDIKRGALGSYFLKIDKFRAVRARRVG